ncbi:MAG: LapA family protein [Pseudomonadota bacterium]
MVRGIGTIAMLLMSAVVVVLAVANRDPVTVTLDPFGSDPQLSATVPLYAVVFGSLAAGAILGAFVTRKKRRSRKP